MGKCTKLFVTQYAQWSHISPLEKGHYNHSSSLSKWTEVYCNYNICTKLSRTLVRITTLERYTLDDHIDTNFTIQTYCFALLIIIVKVNNSTH